LDGKEVEEVDALYNLDYSERLVRGAS